ncbi:divisome protein SepX/GlpR [Spongiactinospora gelatinilytica]|uniref:divisome protein SepX/GlpR n=1 Tax=Spongiactinospora gelatinilytica TaxID=2666298 RepID=UPI0011B934A2|nr:hypothetical protein [Spongiactinospora gelatinilytica]
MSSALLYVAIVLMWLGVLIPMWLRRDKGDLVEPRDLGVHDGVGEEYTGPIMTAPAAAGSPDSAETEEVSEAEAAETSEAPVEADTAVAPPPAADLRRAAHRRRAVVVATRRRRLFWCALLILASVITAAVRVIPWWGIAPSALLTLGYLAVLRTAVRLDREHARHAAEARARRARARRRALDLAAQQPQAEIIDLTAHQPDEIFDQYADPPRRAVGD